MTLYQGGFIIDAETEAEARVEALQCLAESLDLFVVREVELGAELLLIVAVFVIASALWLWFVAAVLA